MDNHEASVLIRFSRLDDTKSIFDIHLKSLKGLDAEDYEWFYNLMKVKSKRRIVLVAEYDGKVVGFLIAYKYYNKIYIDSLAIDPDYRGLGIGTKLLNGLEDLVRGKNKKKIYLSVKKDNYNALGFYLKNGYLIDGVVLELQLLIDKYRSRKVSGYSFILENASNIGIKKHMLSTTMWSNITEPVDKLVYHNITKEKVLVTYRDGRLRGLAEFQPEEVIDIDYLGVSYHKPLEALDALIDKLVGITKTYGSKTILINIDSTKTKMINELLSMGFRITSSEYRLKKVV